MRGFPRKFVLSLCVLTLAACAPDAADNEMEMEEAAEAEMAAEAPMEEMSPMAQWEGTWEAVAMMESGDTVSYSFTATDSRDGWMVSLPDRDPMPLRIVMADADSIVTEMGPYEITATTITTTATYKPAKDCTVKKKNKSVIVHPISY